MDQQKRSKQQAFLNQYARVPPQKKEWHDLEYQLQIALASSTVVCRNIWTIANANMSLNFEKKNKVEKKLILIITLFRAV